MSIDCTEWHEQIWLWLEGDLNAAEIDALQTHLKGCADCRLEVARQRQLTQLLTVSSMIAPVPGFTIRFQDRLQARRLRARTWLGVGTLILASLTGVIAFASALLLSGSSWWQALPLQSMLNAGVKASIALSESLATILDVLLLIGRVFARGLNQPAFAIYAIFTAMIAMTWIFVVGKRSSRLAPATMEIQ
jgi:predicted anti-sigma-YlaC factor YlaD